MKKNDRVEYMGTSPNLKGKRGRVLGVSIALVIVRFENNDYDFSLMEDDLRVISAIELLAEKAE